MGANWAAHRWSCVEFNANRSTAYERNWELMVSAVNDRVGRLRVRVIYDGSGKRWIVFGPLMGECLFRIVIEIVLGIL